MQAVVTSPAGRFHAGRWLLASGLTVAAVAAAGLNVVVGTDAAFAPGGPYIVGCAAGLGVLIALVAELVFLTMVAIVGGGIAALGAILYWRGSAGGPAVMILANLLAILGFGYRSAYPTQQIWATVVIFLALTPIAAIVVLIPPLRSLPVVGRGWLVGVLGAIAAPCLLLAVLGLGQDVGSVIQAPPAVARSGCGGGIGRLPVASVAWQLSSSPGRVAISVTKH